MTRRRVDAYTHRQLKQSEALMGPDFDDWKRAAETCNFSVYRPGQRRGHYESYFQRANHPTRPLAFWIRYTIFSPKKKPSEAIGELWAVYFDGEQGKNIAVRSEFPFAACYFSGDRFDVDVNGSTLDEGGLRGQAEWWDNTIGWDLEFRTEADPLFFFPRRLYQMKFPKAKAVVSKPFAVFSGVLTVNGETINVNEWVGSQNHNWGPKHTDNYAWGQVAGFDNQPDAFLEVGTARLKMGPVWTPRLTAVVLRVGDEQHTINTVIRTLKNEGRFDYFDWTFAAMGELATITGRIHAPEDHFVALNYLNPPGGIKTCLNTKTAACELKVEYLDGRQPRELSAKHRAAFEILTDDDNHGLRPRA